MIDSDRSGFDSFGSMIQRRETWLVLDGSFANEPFAAARHKRRRCTWMVGIEGQNTLTIDIP